MNSILKGLLGAFCLLLGPMIILVSATAVIDSVGLLLVIVGLGLLAWSIIGSVRRSQRR